MCIYIYRDFFLIPPPGWLYLQLWSRCDNQCCLCLAADTDHEQSKHTGKCVEAVCTEWALQWFIRWDTVFPWMLEPKSLSPRASSSATTAACSSAMIAQSLGMEVQRNGFVSWFLVLLSFHIMCLIFSDFSNPFLCLTHSLWLGISKWKVAVCASCQVRRTRIWLRYCRTPNCTVLKLKILLFKQWVKAQGIGDTHAASVHHNLRFWTPQSCSFRARLLRSLMIRLRRQLRRSKFGVMKHDRGKAVNHTLELNSE